MLVNESNILYWEIVLLERLMMAALDAFAQVWFKWMFVSFAIGFLGMLLLIVMLRKQKDNRNQSVLVAAIMMVGQLILTWIIGFGIAGFLKAEARKEVLFFLTKDEVTITINGKVADQNLRSVLLLDLVNLRSFQAHHSHPTDKFQISLIQQSDTLTLSLERDSNFHSEYWVFLKKYSSTSSNEIGRLVTGAKMQ